MIERYLTGFYGILHTGQYLYLFLLSYNPALFPLFKWRHFAFFLVGVALSVFNHRAILPFLLFIIIDLDYSKCDKRMKQKMLGYFLVASGIISIFGGGA